jgi:hypothetical protein
VIGIPIIPKMRAKGLTVTLIAAVAMLVAVVIAAPIAEGIVLATAAATGRLATFPPTEAAAATHRPSHSRRGGDAEHAHGHQEEGK